MNIELPTDLATLLSGLQTTILEMDAKLTAIHTELSSKPSGPVIAREWYSVDEAAKLLGKRPYSVRNWARLGRINAAKRAERRGSTALWAISAEEVARYREEGLLPIDPERNNRN
jgi:hypothetical protein